MLDQLRDTVDRISAGDATLRATMAGAGPGDPGSREDSPEGERHIYGQAIPAPRGQRADSYYCPLCRQSVDAMHYEGLPHHDRLMLVRDIADLLAGVTGRATECHMGEVTQFLWERGIFK